MAHKVIVVGGGVRSGKSAFALHRARELGGRRVFVATGEALDDEMHVRVQRHREERGDTFRTVEAPRALCSALEAIHDADVVVIDCLTLWLSNLLCDGLDEAQLLERVEELAHTLERRRFSSIIVTNEVGLGIVPENALARLFRDVTGRAHQRLGRCADEVYFAALGQLVRFKPAPVLPAEWSR